MRAEAPGGGGEVVVYETPGGEVRVDVRLERETVWLTQQQMADLFGRERSVVTKHIRNAYKEGELDPSATSAKFAQVRSEGGRAVSREVDHYNLDVIISVGYRVKSLRRNGLLLRADGRPRLADNAMVALALLIAESEPGQKDLMIRLVLNLLEDEAR